MKNPLLFLIMGVSLIGCAVDRGPPGLRAKEWQLVRIQDGSGAVYTPDVKAKYTLEFDALGGVDLRIDCNRGRAKWASPAPGQLLLGPLALTRAACPRGSLHDRIVKQLPNIRSYVVRDGRLFLILMADGGALEYEPATLGKVTVP
jgi:para-nitrobenzyl esterase